MKKIALIGAAGYIAPQVLSLPIHTEIENSSQDFIIQKVKDFFNKI